jgi:deazaflavin-dependent oxidoreductase (nitroreductase family)
MPSDPRDHATERFCYLTTTGRVSGKPHTLEIWFAFPPDAQDRTLYMMSGGRGRADWVKNLRRTPAVSIRIEGDTYRARARVIEPDTAEDTTARHALCGKYQGWREGRPLSEWGRTSLPVAFEVED